MCATPDTSVKLRKLNLGCGNRFASGWINLDFNSVHPDVISHNLLRPLPFENDFFDVVYSSQVLEHFSRNDGVALVKESSRVLKPGGIIRFTVPDLEQTCREYIRILDSVEQEPASQKKYEWILIEMLDQYVRSKEGGDMTPYWKKILHNNDSMMLDYVEERLGESVSSLLGLSVDGPRRERGIGSSFRRIRSRGIWNNMLIALRRYFPFMRSLFVELRGEKHKWAYDRYSMKLLMENAGIEKVQFLSANVSSIDGFAEDNLEPKIEGKSFPGRLTLFCEGRKSFTD